MKRVILDTNIYGLIVVDKDRNKVRHSVEEKKTVVVYGLPLIRKELRDTPRNIRVGGTNLRNDLLRIYDEFTKNHMLKHMAEAEKLADLYFNVYKELGGFASKHEIVNDLSIVAFASLNALDIVISNDSKTMLSEKTVKSYSIVNQIKKIRIPRFLNYEQFKQELK